ncbi:MAG: hypothetical protein M3088_03130, partial [Actinomycetota bacterium]|nr:hypothetical protein [Actinomycetota bacterium]
MSSLPPDPTDPQGGGAAPRPPLPTPAAAQGLPPVHAGQSPPVPQDGASEAAVGGEGAPGGSSIGPGYDVGEPGWSAWQGVLGFVAALV